MTETNKLIFRLYDNLKSAAYERCFQCCEKAGTLYEDCGKKCINMEENCEVRNWLETLSKMNGYLNQTQAKTSC